jgi:poly(3-hydroxybutyrate) depolymerase
VGAAGTAGTMAAAATVEEPAAVVVMMGEGDTDTDTETAMDMTTGMVTAKGTTDGPWPDAVRNDSVGGESIIVSEGWNRRSCDSNWEVLCGPRAG